MKYSFVIPTYNKKEPLVRTLEALNNLSGYSRDDVEAVVVDDGSTEEVFKIIKGVNRTYRLNYIYLQRCEDSCRSRTRNYGINAARGTFIIFIDDDIVVNSDYLQELARYFNVSHHLVIIGTRLNFPAHLLGSTDIKELRRTACQEANTDVLELRHPTFNRLSYNLAAYKYPWMMTFTSNLAVPRQLLLDIAGFDENFKKWGYEDLELGYRLHKTGVKFVLNPRIEAFHQAHPKAPTGENNLDYFLEKCQEIFKEIDYSTLHAVHALGTDDPSLLAVYRKYQGKIHTRATVELRQESDLENIKKRILELAKKKGSEIIVNDYCENTDLDVWVQMLEPENAVISYFPRSFHISGEKHVEFMKKVLFEKDKFSFR